MTDQHIAAIATIAQDVILLISAALIWWYLWETRKMRKAAEDQVSKSQELVLAAQQQTAAGQRQVGVSQQQVTAAYEQLHTIRQQVAVALDQLEGQIRPALVARLTQHGIELVNIGSGPALHVRLSPAERGGGAFLTVHPFSWPHDRIAFLEPGQTRQTVVQCQTNPAHAGAPALNGKSLQCTYKSLSGRIHYTVIDFTGTNIDDTRFYEHEPEQ